MFKLPASPVRTFAESTLNWEALAKHLSFFRSEVDAATTLGTVNGKIEVFDSEGNSLGFVPVYDTIT